MEKAGRQAIECEVAGHIVSGSREKEMLVLSSPVFQSGTQFMECCCPKSEWISPPDLTLSGNSLTDRCLSQVIPNPVRLTEKMSQCNSPILRSVASYDTRLNILGLGGSDYGPSEKATAQLLAS